MPISEPNRDAVYPRSGGVPTTFADTAPSAFNLDLEANLTTSRFIEQQQQYQRLMDAYGTATGKSIAAPSAHEADIQRFWGELSAARAEHPDAFVELPSTQEEIDRAIVDKMTGLERAHEELVGRATFGGQIGRFVGSAGALLLDPLMLPTFFFGPLRGAGILKGAIQEAGIAAAAETGIQAIVQPNRAAMGLDAGVDKAIENILTASLGSGVLYAGLRTIGVGYKALAGKYRESVPEARQTPVEQQAARLLEDTAESLTTRNPYGNPSEAEVIQHAMLLTKAAMDLEDGRATNVQGLLPAEWTSVRASDLANTAMRAVEVRARLAPVIRELGLDVDEVMPGLSYAMESVQDGVVMAMSRARVEEMAARLERVSGAERKLLTELSVVETKVGDLFEEKSRIRALISLYSRGRAGDMKALEQSLEAFRSWGPKLGDFFDLEQKIAGGAGGLESARTARLERFRAALDRRIETAEAKLAKLSDEAEPFVKRRDTLNDELQIARRASEKAARRFDERLRQPFSKEAVERELQAVRTGARPILDSPSTERNIAEGEQAARQMEADEKAAPERQEAEVVYARELTDEEDIDIEVDGEMVSAKAALKELDDDEAMLKELDNCLLGVVEEAA